MSSGLLIYECYGDNKASGIGEEIALQLYKLNCTVIIASRSPSKCKNTVEKIRAASLTSKGVVEAIPLDISNLDNVVEFVNIIRKKYTKLNFLVNNAGMMYLTNMDSSSAESPLRSPQGYDQAFATNFLGHFLLTELLLPLLKITPQARILNVASSVHLQVDGEALRPPRSDTSDTKDDSSSMPLAARSDIYTTRHWLDSYGNSKLAQLLHMNMLQPILDQDSSTDLKVVSVCPGFVNSGMVPERPLAQFVSRMFYSCRAATLAPICGLLDSTLRGGEWLTNFNVFWTSNAVAYLCMKFYSAIGLRDIFISCVATPQVMLFQNVSYGIHQSTASSEARDMALSSDFYQWCLQVTEDYRGN